jgi:hypothetical protein
MYKNSKKRKSASQFILELKNRVERQELQQTPEDCNEILNIYSSYEKNWKDLLRKDLIHSHFFSNGIFPDSVDMKFINEKVEQTFPVEYPQSIYFLKAVEETKPIRDKPLKQKEMLFQCIQDPHGISEDIGDIILEYTGHLLPRP